LAAAVTEARIRVADRMTTALDEVASSIDGEVLGRSSIDECYAGQRNWKVDTGYDHRCSLVTGVLIGTDGDFRARMLDLDRSLEELGWLSHDGEWPGQLVDEYWDLRAAESPDGDVPLGRLPGPLSVVRDGLRIRFAYTDADDDAGLRRLDRFHQTTVWCCGLPFHEDRRPLDLAQITRARTPRFLVLAIVEGHYVEQ
jgi:hypothetical protein